MREEEIESILIANRYLILCKSDNRKLLLARKYLTHKIKKALSKNEPTELPLFKLSILGFIFVVH
jgi:hypothetical protein